MRKLILLLFALSLLSTISCNNDDDNNTGNPILQLPPETQTGANTFGCLLDGEPFIPSGGINPLDAVYQFINGGYNFNLQGNKRDNNNNLIGITLNSMNLELNELNTYILEENATGNTYGGLFSELDFNYTSQVYTGELTISKLDTENQIVSGTFWFDVEDQNGTVHEIREGRFDMQYTQ
jgi:hypothetical protein